MHKILAVINLVLFIALVVGLIRPKVVLRSAIKNTRLKVFLIYGIPFIIFSFVQQKMEKNQALPEIPGASTQENNSLSQSSQGHFDSLSHKEKLKLLTECNQKYIDPKIEAKTAKLNGSSSNVDEDAFRKVIENPNTLSTEALARQEAAMTERSHRDSECQRIYDEIYDRTLANENEVTRQAELKFPMYSKESFVYARELTGKFQKQILQDYQITNEQFWKIFNQLYDERQALKENKATLSKE